MDKEKSMHDIQIKLEGLGEYVQIEYLTRCLKEHLDLNTKKFVLDKLSGIYEEKGMFAEAGKMSRNSAEINPVSDDKVKGFLIAGGMFVKAGNFIEAENAFAGAMSFSKESNKTEIKNTKKEIYKFQARALESKDKRRNALMVYERLITMDLSIQERREVQEKLLGLYEKLGKISDYIILKEIIKKEIKP